MRSPRFRTRVVRALHNSALDTGRLLFLLVILSIGYSVSLLVATYMHGTIFVTSGEATPFEAFNAGGRSAFRIFASFSEPQSSFYFMSTYSALFMGAAGYWLYEEVQFRLRRWRRWG
jgi:hypothetical protein